MEKTTQTPGAADFDTIKDRIPMDPDEEEQKEEEKAPEPEKKDEPAPTPAPEPAKEEPKPEEPPKGERPERYIPIAQYTDEKRGWRESEEGYKTRIAELEGIVGGKEGTPSNDAKVKAYAQKYGVTEEAVRDLVGLMAADKEPASPAKLSPEQEAELASARQVNAEKAFDSEYASLAIPALKLHFPNATEAQLAAAKEDIKKAACTKEFLKSPLDLIVMRTRENLATHFKEDRKGPEGQRGAEKQPTTLHPSDFKDGKTPFTELASLSVEERDRIVKGFDSKTWDSYVHYVKQNDELRIS